MKKKIVGIILCVLALAIGLALSLAVFSKRNDSQATKKDDREVKISEQTVKKEGKQEGEAAPELSHKVKDACSILDDTNAKNILGESVVKKGLRVTFEGRIQVTQCSYESDAYKVVLTLRQYTNPDDAKKQLSALKAKTPQTIIRSEYILSAAATNNAGTTANTEKGQTILDEAMKGL